jgi:hypothetical protein
MAKTKMPTAALPASPLLRPESLLAAVWPDPTSRPSCRWLRGVTAAQILPSYKIGRFRFYRAEEVVAALEHFRADDRPQGKTARK